MNSSKTIADAVNHCRGEWSDNVNMVYIYYTTVWNFSDVYPHNYVMDGDMVFTRDDFERFSVNKP